MWQQGGRKKRHGVLCVAGLLHAVEVHYTCSPYAVFVRRPKAVADIFHQFHQCLEAAECNACAVPLLPDSEGVCATPKAVSHCVGFGGGWGVHACVHIINHCKKKKLSKFV